MAFYDKNTKLFLPARLHLTLTASTEGKSSRKVAMSHVLNIIYILIQSTTTTFHIVDRLYSSMQVKHGLSTVWNGS